MTTERTLVLPAPLRAQVSGLLIIAASLVYLLAFVGRGWVPHDEGMIGQSAERVLRGEMPHVDYQEPYTGALTWLYAGLFRLTGVELLNVRWLLFVGASLAVWTVYAILRRWLQPVGAAFATAVALVWSFPNYFAGLPSWWILICSLVFLWASIRHIETGQHRYAALGGLAVGTAIVIKQTGVYLLMPLVMSLAYESTPSVRTRTGTGPIETIFRFVIATTALILGIVVLRSRLQAAEMVYLLLPIAASTLVLLSSRETTASPRGSVPILTIALSLACAMLPLGLLFLGYAVRGQVTEFVQGVAFLPQKRLTFASMVMPSASLAVTGAAALLVFFAEGPRGFGSRLWSLARWGVAGGLAVLSLHSVIAYRFVWHSSRAVAALIPLVICWMLISCRTEVDRHRQVLFLSSSTLAWASLVQFPFSAPIYFCYVAPLVVIAVVGTARGISGPRCRTLVPWGFLLLTFGVLSLNRGNIYNLGWRHIPQELSTPLDLPKAHLTVSVEDARTYQEVVRLIGRHLKGGVLIAEPDCPELYFLVDRFSPGGALFDFFSQGEPPEGGTAGYADVPSDVTVWVLNHEPSFSPPPSPARTSKVRASFPHGQRVGGFEVRWR